MAGSWDQKNRMVKGGGREAASFSKAYAHAMEDYCAHCGQDSYSMLGEVSETTR